VTKYDVAVVGGGPSGSTTAHLLAKAGVKVVLLDRARFPREKPCGGGVTGRAYVESPVDLTPMVEQRISRVRFSYKLGTYFDHDYHRTMVYMTQRHRLDAFLLEKAGEAGADVQDGRKVLGVEMTPNGVSIAVDGGKVEASVVVGADGSTGVVARGVGLRPVQDPPVALEANFPYKKGDVPAEWRDMLALELGSMDGGYGWSFPKADHFIVGCGGFSSVGGKLRDHLAKLRHHYALDDIPPENIRGHHLPTRDGDAPIVRGRALLVGDAAGLVDPMSGEGIYSAFVSGRLAAEAIGKFLDGTSPDLYPYEAAVERELMADMRAATLLRDAYHYTPWPSYWVMSHSSRMRQALCQLATGERTYADFIRAFGPMMPALRIWAARGRAARAAASS
jgi:geranylgeranyl reductase family protein